MICIPQEGHSQILCPDLLRPELQHEVFDIKDKGGGLWMDGIFREWSIPSQWR